VRDLQEAGWLPGGANVAFDVSSSIDEDGPLGTILGGFFHFDPITTWLQLTVWVVYLVVTLAIYLRPQRPSAPVDVTAPQDELV
jgi:high-affinity iron transporter